MFHYPITLSILALQLPLTSMTASHNLFHHLNTWIFIPTVSFICSFIRNSISVTFLLVTLNVINGEMEWYKHSSIFSSVGIKINYHLLTSIYVTSILSYTVLEDDANDEK
ncbi:SX2_G0004150.mRNA.1.CDS.1 [Saccharomyces cerevisiae]|nr:SX2_G0004150.mRNA.1.CDS.1 [Saccharomyces cerevisiae]